VGRGGSGNRGGGGEEMDNRRDRGSSRDIGR